MLTKVVVLSVAIVAILICSVRSAQQKTTLDVYYESLCPDSKRFITNQLFPNWESLSTFVDIRLIPFGKATYVEIPNGGGYEFSCQHGPEECKGNILHACGIDLTAKSKTQVDYANCLMLAAGDVAKCSRQAGLDDKKIQTCAKDLKGQTLHKIYGDETLNLKPTLTFVPWLIFNKNWSEDNQWDGLNDIMKVACKNAPANTPACAASKVTSG